MDMLGAHSADCAVRLATASASGPALRAACRLRPRLACGQALSGALFLSDRLYTLFDGLAQHHGVFKVETIGDAFMAVAGLPRPQPDHSAWPRATLAAKRRRLPPPSRLCLSSAAARPRRRSSARGQVRVGSAQGCQLCAGTPPRCAAPAPRGKGPRPACPARRWISPTRRWVSSTSASAFTLAASSPRWSAPSARGTACSATRQGPAPCLALRQPPALYAANALRQASKAAWPCAAGEHRLPDGVEQREEQSEHERGCCDGAAQDGADGARVQPWHGGSEGQGKDGGKSARPCGFLTAAPLVPQLGPTAVSLSRVAPPLAAALFP